MGMSPLFNFKLLFAVEAVAALLLFVKVLQPKRHFAARLAVGTLGLLAFAFLLPTLGTGPAGLTFLFLALFGATLVLIRFCSDAGWSTIFFCGISAYTAQHLADSVYELLLLAGNLEGLRLFGYDETTVMGGPSFASVVSFIIYFDVYFVVYWAVYLAWDKRLTQNENILVDNGQVLVLSGFLICSEVILNACVVSHAVMSPDRVYQFLSKCYGVLCCVFVYLLEFGILDERHLAAQAEANRQLWLQQRQQYVLAKENIERINLKCHDLKHQIRHIGESASVEPGVLKELEHTISIYDSNIQSGNTALNTILTEKQLLCGERGIKLTCLADGATLAFMRDEDIYSLFGNALDNAIEATLQLDDADRRVIGLKVKGAAPFVLVHVYNYFKVAPKTVDGLLVTSKRDTSEHGYGVKSMREIVARYGGTLTFSTEGDVFNLNISLPVPE